ncbi:MAG: periplasmic heavy metal sensor [Acidobacteria bacterium]|nr:periplasmic heavy metal sensor [Acidobacteriota bacterium]
MRVIAIRLAALAIGLALFAGMAVAQDQTTPPAGGHRMHAGFMGAPGWGMLFHNLELSDNQKAQVKQIMQGERATMRPLMQQEMAAREKMMQLITSGNFDQAQASAIAAQESQTHMQLQLEQAKIASQIYLGVLNTEQKNTVTKMMSQHQHLMQGKGDSAQPDQ